MTIGSTSALTALEKRAAPAKSAVAAEAMPKDFILSGDDVLELGYVRDQYGCVTIGRDVVDVLCGMVVGNFPCYSGDAFTFETNGGWMLSGKGPKGKMMYSTRVVK